jgi:GxxExxY protein
LEEQYPHKELTRKIIGAAMEVYKTLACGFLESVYEEALTLEFRLQNIEFERQKPLDVFYKGTKVKQFVCDFLVEGSVLVELKAIKELTPLETGQVLNYLKSTDLKLGLLLNFGASSLQYKRVIN